MSNTLIAVIAISLPVLTWCFVAYLIYRHRKYG